MNSDYEISFKIVFAGDSNCGKTSIIKCCRHNYLSNSLDFFLDDSLPPTIGVDYICIRQTVVLDDGKDCILKFSIWDTGGHDNYKNICKIYFKDISCAIVVFNLCDNDSFLNVKKWINNINNTNNNNKDDLIYVIIGNKSDLVDPTISTDYNSKCKELLKDFNINHIYYETSVKSNNNIKECFNELTYILLETFTSKFNIKKNQKGIQSLVKLNCIENSSGINILTTLHSNDRCTNRKSYCFR